MGRERNSSLILLPVEKGIPIPPVEKFPKWRRPIKYKISIKRLFIGDSVFIPESDQPPQAEMSLLRRKLGRNHVYRKVKSEDGVVLGIRVWRVEDNPGHLITPEAKRKNEMEELKQNMLECSDRMLELCDISLELGNRSLVTSGWKMVLNSKYTGFTTPELKNIKYHLIGELNNWNYPS